MKNCPCPSSEALWMWIKEENGGLGKCAECSALETMEDSVSGKGKSNKSSHTAQMLGNISTSLVTWAQASFKGEGEAKVKLC